MPGNVIYNYRPMPFVLLNLELVNDLERRRIRQLLTNCCLQGIANHNTHWAFLIIFWNRLWMSKKQQFNLEINMYIQRSRIERPTGTCQRNHWSSKFHQERTTWVDLLKPRLVGVQWRTRLWTAPCVKSFTSMIWILYTYIFFTVCKLCRFSCFPNRIV